MPCRHPHTYLALPDRNIDDTSPLLFGGCGGSIWKDLLIPQFGERIMQAARLTRQHVVSDWPNRSSSSDPLDWPKQTPHSHTNLVWRPPWTCGNPASSTELAGEHHTSGITDSYIWPKEALRGWSRVYSSARMGPTWSLSSIHTHLWVFLV